MTSHVGVWFNDPPVTENNSMDVDESAVSQMALDDLYLGPDEDIEYDSVSSSGLDVLGAITDQSPLAQADHPGLPIDSDLYLGPDDNLIDYDEELESADAGGGAPAAP